MSSGLGSDQAKQHRWVCRVVEASAIVAPEPVPGPDVRLGIAGSHATANPNCKSRKNAKTVQPGAPGSPSAIGSVECGHRAVNPNGYARLFNADLVGSITPAK
jgi:hypothetical protein